MIEEWLIKEPEPNPFQRKEEPERCIIALPGLGNSAGMVSQIAENLCLPNTLIVAMRSVYWRWYPQPISAMNQGGAAAGVPLAREVIERHLRGVEAVWNIPRSKTALLGYSAGAVMSLQIMAHADEPFAACVSLCGAILEPKKLPECKHKKDQQTAVLLVHNQDDLCFEWEERYLPMKKALRSKGYRPHVLENPYGGHHICWEDELQVSKFVGQRLVSKDWEHPRQRDLRD